VEEAMKSLACSAMYTSIFGDTGRQA